MFMTYLILSYSSLKTMQINLELYIQFLWAVPDAWSRALPHTHLPSPSLNFQTHEIIWPIIWVTQTSQSGLGTFEPGAFIYPKTWQQLYVAHQMNTDHAWGKGMNDWCAWHGHAFILISAMGPFKFHISHC